MLLKRNGRSVSTIPFHSKVLVVLLPDGSLAMFSTGSWKLVVNQVRCLICFPPDHFLVHGLPGCASQCEWQVTRIPKWWHWWPLFALAGCSWELLCSSHGWLRSDVPGYVIALYQLCLELLGGCFGFSWYDRSCPSQLEWSVKEHCLLSNVRD